MALSEDHLRQSLTPGIEDTTPAVRINVDAFDNLIEDQGMLFVHFRAMPCPVGKSDRFDVRKTHDDHAGCSNGFLYLPAGTVTAVVSGNSRSKSLIDVGVVNSSSMQVTPARHYADKPEEEIVFAPFDRLYLKDSNALVVHSQLFEANMSGMDRLQYPVVSIEHIIDSNGQTYEFNHDYVIKKGQIAWIGGKRPGSDPATSKGQVCSVRYRYIPYWYVDKILHEIRMVKAYNEKTSRVEAVRMPFSLVLQRENVFEATEQADEKSDSPRQPVAPRQGSFGPR